MAIPNQFQFEQEVDLFVRHNIGKRVWAEITVEMVVNPRATPRMQRYVERYNQNYPVGSWHSGIVIGAYKSSQGSLQSGVGTMKIALGVDPLPNIDETIGVPTSWSNTRLVLSPLLCASPQQMGLTHVWAKSYDVLQSSDPRKAAAPATTFHAYVPRAAAPAKRIISEFPHSCPSCQGPAYIGFQSITCQRRCK